MVFRLNNTGLNTSAANFRGGSIAAAGAQATQGIGQAVGALDGIMQKEAELFYETQLTDFGLGLDSDLSEMARNALGGEGFQEGATKLYDTRKAEIYKRAGANPYKRKMLDEYFRKSEGKAKAGFENTQRELGIEYSTFLHGQHRDDAMQEAGRQVYVGESGSKTAYGATDVHSVIRHFEGFRTTPYWDVNALRTGYGSDTVTRKDGSVHRVTKNTKVTRADAERDLARRARQFANGVAKKVGGRTWGALSSSQQAALTSIAYNYGSLPNSVASAVRNGGDVGKAIRGLRGHNKGVNAKRRDQEAAIYETGSLGGIDQNGVAVYDGPVPDVFANPAVAARRDDLFAEIDAMDISANQKAELKAETTSKLAQAGLVQIANENPSAALAALRSGNYDEAISYQFDQRLQTSAQGDVDRARKAWETQVTDIAKEQQRVLKQEAVGMALDHNAWQAGGRQGDAPPALSAEHYGSLTPAQQRAYDKAAQVGDAVSGARQVDLPQADAYLEGIKPGGDGFDAETDAFAAAKAEIDSRFLDATKGATLAERQRIIEITDDEDRKNGLIAQQKDFLARLKKDQVGLMADAGIDLPQLDGERIAASLSQRFGFVSDFAEKNGVAPVIMTPAERVVFTEQFEQMGIADKIAFVADMAQDPEAANHLYAEIGEVAPFLSHVGGMSISGASIDGISVAMRGYQADKDGLKFDGLSTAEKTQQVGSSMREALRGIPNALSAADTFATNYARGKSLDNGGEVQPDHYAEGMETALGEAYQYGRRGRNGKHMLLPPNVSGTEMTDFINGITDESLREMNGGELPKGLDGEELDADYLRDNADFLTIGAGQYVFEFDDGTAIGSDGMPFVLQYQVAE